MRHPCCLDDRIRRKYSYNIHNIDDDEACDNIMEQCYSLFVIIYFLLALCFTNIFVVLSCYVGHLTSLLLAKA
jgi:hypothetical protein